MTRIRRGGYVFITYVGDHSPRHVHVIRNGRTIGKWDLERGRWMSGSPSRRAQSIIRELEEEGLL